MPHQTIQSLSAKQAGIFVLLNAQEVFKLLAFSSCKSDLQKAYLTLRRGKGEQVFVTYNSKLRDFELQ